MDSNRLFLLEYARHLMMICLALLVCCLGGLVSSAPQKFYELNNAEDLFVEFMRNYNRQYVNDEEKLKRFEIFKKNLQEINERNKRSETAPHGINMFADMEFHEFSRKYTGCLQGNVNPCQLNNATQMKESSAPDEFDWRDKKVVTRVKNQGNCGSCWAFSATGNLEGQYALKHSELKEFSESQLVDCDTHSFGCAGGLMSYAFIYLMEAGGSMSEQDYPYTPSDGSCRFDKNKVTAKVTGCNQYTFANEDELKETLHSVGPLSISLDANSFQTYSHGILDNCEKGAINHGVLLVGYGTENNVPYWLIKNSWDTTFGENGYIRIKRNVNSCNIMNEHAQIVSAVVA